MSENLWLVGRYISKHEDGPCWEWIGIFDSEQKAIDSCRDESYFIGPATLNEVLPNETVDWPRCYYPMTNYPPTEEDALKQAIAEAEASDAPKE